MATERTRPKRSVPGPTKVLRREQGFVDLQRRFGRELRRRRDELGWTQQHAAELLGLSWRHLQDIEGGQVNITLLLLYRFSEVYAFEVTALFGAHADPAPDASFT